MPAASRSTAGLPDLSPRQGLASGSSPATNARRWASADALWRLRHHGARPALGRASSSPRPARRPRRDGDTPPEVARTFSPPLAGIAPEWWEVSGNAYARLGRHQARAALRHGPAAPHARRRRAKASIICASWRRAPPRRRWPSGPPCSPTGGRRFGLSAQLYTLRRPGDQGIGDFRTLEQLGKAGRRQGRKPACPQSVPCHVPLQPGAGQPLPAFGPALPRPGHDRARCGAARSPMRAASRCPRGA